MIFYSDAKLILILSFADDTAALLKFKLAAIFSAVLGASMPGCK